MDIFVKYLGYLIVLVVLAVPLGFYINKVMNGKKVFLSRILEPCENFIYRVLHVKKDEEMSWKKYLVSVLIFSGFGLVFVFLLQMLQGVLPGNPAKVEGTTWDLALNTAISFVTNTNWQAYSGESGLSYLTQSLGLTVQNFVSAGTGLAVLYALIRGFTRIKAKGLGNFWVDLTRSVIYVLMPLSVVLSIILVSQGVTQSIDEYQTVKLAEPIVLEDGTEITEQTVPLGPAASQIAIKQLGTNGGGFNGANSASALENPTPLTNFLQCVAMPLVPFALILAFGRMVGDRRQGRALMAAVLVLLTVGIVAVVVAESQATPQLAADGSVYTGGLGQAAGNMEGKEVRIGVGASALWTAFTTAIANGSSNASLVGMTPMGTLVPLVFIGLGEVVGGGAGTGLAGLIGFTVLAVFVASLMVGRSPQYLGKKIGPAEMRMATVMVVAPALVILAGAVVLTLSPVGASAVGEGGPFGFSQLLYAATSAGGNNGSGLGGLDANLPLINLVLGGEMLLGRLIPVAAALALAGHLASREPQASGAATLSTASPLFVTLLLVIIVLVGALTLLPALALGPVAEQFAGAF